ncbi:uncharacterized protein LOC144146494 [Haemaphysalis longicornis]
MCATTAFSLDIEDLYYSIPHGPLFLAVRERIEECGEVKFQNAAGVTGEQFLELLELYLISTAIRFDNAFYVQKKGTSIGSSVAPALCDIFLASIDRRVAEEISDLSVVKTYRYVDDYLVFLNTSGVTDLNSVIEEVKGKKKERAHLERNTTHVIPYFHRISHNVKKVAARYKVNVLFSAPCKLERLCPMMEKKETKGGYTKKHEKRYTDCVRNVVYEIPLRCGFSYIRQTGRCFNDRAREHQLAVRSNLGGHMNDHCKRLEIRV